MDGNILNKTFNKVKVNKLINFDIKPDYKVKVSVIVPVCNVQDYLRECLDSIINQSLKEIEIICVNDGSTDNSEAILEEYAEKDSRVKIIDKENAGYGHAMNIGMFMASGEYTGIVESDDFVELNMYHDLYETAKNYLYIDIVKADFCRFSREFGYFSCTEVKLSENIKYYNRVINPLKEKEVFLFPMNTWSGIYKTEFLRAKKIAHNETPGASYQDNGFWFQTFCLAESIVFVDQSYYMNRRNNPNSSVYNSEKVYCICDEYEYIYKFLENNPEIKKEVLGYYWLKKYHNYDFTLNRIAYMYKKEFAQRMQAEFTSSEFNEQVKWRLFTKKEQEDILYLRKDVDLYLDKLDYVALNNSKINVIIVKVGDSVISTFNSVANQNYGKINIICVGKSFNEDEKALFAKDDRTSYIEEEADISELINIAIPMTKGVYLHIVTSGTILNSALYKTAVLRLENDENSAYICAANKRISKNIIVKDYDNFKDALLNDGVVVPANNKFILFASGVSLNNKIFRVDGDFVVKKRLLSCDADGNSPYFVVSTIKNCKKIYVDSNRFIENSYNAVRHDVEKFLHEYAVLSKIIGGGGALLNSFVNLFASQLLHVMSERRENFRWLYDNREEVLDIAAINCHTGDYYFNGYVYDILFEVFKQTKNQELAAIKFNEYLQAIYLTAINRIDYIGYSVDSSDISKARLTGLIEEKDKLIGDYNALLNSLSFRVGRLITFLPRKIRDFIRPYRTENNTNKKLENQLKKIDSLGMQMLERKVMPLVSIVIPMFNGGAYVDRCLRSLENQSYRNIEIICVDDGSTDNTCEITEQHTIADNRISLYRQNHLYAGIARNEGLKHARGKYVIFLDSDDYFERDMIKLMVARAEVVKAEITVCRCRGFDNATEKNIDMKWSVHEKYLPKKCIFKGDELGEYKFMAFMGWAWDKLYLTKFIKKNNLEFQALRSSNDAFFTFTSIVLANRITFLDKILVNQRRNSKTSISQTRTKSWDNCFLAADKMYEEYKLRNIYSKKTERAFCNWFVQFFCWHYKTFDFKTQELLAEKAKEFAKKYNLTDRPKNFYYMQNDFNNFVEIIKSY